MKVTKLDRVQDAPKAYEGGTSKRTCSAIVDNDLIVVSVDGSTVWRENKSGETYACQTDAGITGTLTFTLQQAANLLVGKFLTDIEGSSLEVGSEIEVPATYGLVGEKTEKVKGSKKDQYLIEAIVEVTKRTSYKSGEAITVENCDTMIEFLKTQAPEAHKAVLSRARALRSAAKPATSVATILDI